MYPVFGRSELQYDAHFERWLNWPNAVELPAYRAMACNMMYDFRVRKVRAECFDNDYLSGRHLEGALKQYFQECVRMARQPHFVQDMNLENIVAGAPTANLIDEDTPLITFLDLNGLDKVYRWAKEHPHPDYRDVFDFYDTRSGDDVLAGWLKDTIESLGEQTVVYAVLAAKRERRKDPGYQHFNPVWATLWSDVSGFLKPELVDRWWELVGVYKASSPRWVVPLRYTVYETGTLARPSVLDASFYAHHFPSPPEAPLREGGCCMDLQTDPAAGRLVHEFIHQEIDFSERHWLNAGSRCLPTSRPSPGNLAEQRQAHYKLLHFCYHNVLDWMPECIG